MDHDNRTELKRERRWLIVTLGVLAVAVGLAAAFAFGFSVGRESSDEAGSAGEQLEAWNRCLVDAGAVVPAVEARRDGGFTITVTAGFFEEFDPRAFVNAVAECESLTPIGLLQAFGQGFAAFLPALRPHGEAPPGLPRDLNRRELAEACEHLRATDRIPEDVPEALLRACEVFED
ncbi:MAG: hypothetical protein ACE5MI_05045 [Acidimicrobiia bacterium]